MNPNFAFPWTLAAVAGLLIAGGLLSLCPLSGECPLVAMVAGRARTGPVAGPQPSDPTPDSQVPDGTPNTGKQDPPEGASPMSTAESEPRLTGEVLHADLASFDQLVLDSEVPVLVDFYADWCRPCQLLSPILTELAREVPDAKIVKVDVDDNPELARRFGISSIPALMLFEDGRVVDSRLGLVDKATLTQWLGS